ncbi:glutamate-1-semialdehyde 2,1-aminomutase [Campylobacter hepaticus]|uniref:Glutamate-1-semialdehyde 2,1-aminomutase n=1 Tax=Campylobacter hepaticus TaxID=1813019 RepID=A0A6A7JR92_9BACT|nr:glutamate-1-semialdehyde 2,1-aminomutase [Campylobacter hepaticus]AXP08604.1 glutamate-1-semialdehyde-2,1-aminomutase [Campylobacter hepaticus]MCZ0772445.1 glutamate-1-semialdehyde 2,1-aminomutase [Campylobacter hepaticus]MCZ0773913.1 glutamate-1-semialdehyde 2,1-aminomutase [Campylobacter hepaticus]MCZ0775164.1 glutamate-1-semialdehyde 2,1-aminomutase [Campylobacter hepaticus]MDX2323332.1 glutamate-1-semialdehyde 2,1-aminomutase [Campylobacter hepaticus]
MTNEKAFEQACKFIAGGVNSPVRAFTNVQSQPKFISHGKGAYIFDIEGNAYIDYVQSWGPLLFGHCDKDIQKACYKALKKGSSFGAPTLLETELAKLILTDFPHLDKIRFVSSGTEATMSAIRLARGFTKKKKILKFEGCYHGHSDSLLVSAGSGAATFNSPSSLGVLEDLAKYTLVAKYNDIQSVEELFKKNKDIACVIIEPIAGNMGLVPAKQAFLEELYKLCKANETLLIFDEVMSGYRASYLGSYGINHIQADIVTFGKVIGGGLPAGAFAAKAEIMDILSPLGGVYQAGTLSGNPLAMAAGIASLTKAKKKINLYEKLGELAKKLTQEMKKLANEKGIPLQICHIGSMFGYFFIKDPVLNYQDALKSDLKLFSKFHKNMLENKIYLAPSQFETGFICSKITHKMIDTTLQAIQESFRKI